jgi:hypothetical protein
VPLGSAAFYDEDFPNLPPATVALDQANGTATLRRAFVIGGHSVTARFVGTNANAADVLPILRRTWIARHSRVYSSIRFSIRTVLPS